jgi:hypothetical protein
MAKYSELPQIVFTITFAVLCFIFINYIALSVAVLFYPYDLDFSEGFVITPAIRLLEGGQLYNDIKSFPYYSVVKYPPVFYIVNAFTMLLLGKTLLSARLISLLSSLGVGYLIFLIVKKRTKNKILGIFSALLFFSSFVMFWHTSQARVDMLALFFSLSGIYLIQDYKKGRNFYLAIMFFVLAFLTKQIFVAAPVASFVYLFFKDRKKSFEFFSIIAVLAVFSFLAINFLTHGGFFAHMFEYSKGIMATDFELLTLLLEKNIMILLISFYYFYKNSSELLGLYFIFAYVLFFSILFLRMGGWVYYFLETAITTSVLAGVILNTVFSGPKKRFFIIVMILLVVQLVIFVRHDPRSVLFIFKSKAYPPLVNIEADNKMASYIQNATANVLVEHASYARANGKEVSPESWSLIELQQNGIVTGEETLEFLENQDYSLIIYYSRFDGIGGFKEYLEGEYEQIDKIRWMDLSFHYRDWLVYEKS